MADWTIERDTRSSSNADFDFGHDIKVVGIDELKLKMHNLMPEVRKALEQTIRKSADQIVGRARALASGDVIKIQTGDFVRSLQSRVTSSENGVMGYVWSNDPDLAAVFEFGGTQGARDILPNVAQALRFAGFGAKISLGTFGEVYANVVHRPVVQYQPKPIIHAAFEEAKVAVQTKIGDAMVTGLKNAGLEHDIESGASSVSYSGD